MVTLAIRLWERGEIGDVVSFRFIRRLLHELDAVGAVHPGVSTKRAAQVWLGSRLHIISIARSCVPDRCVSGRSRRWSVSGRSRAERSREPEVLSDYEARALLTFASGSDRIARGDWVKAGAEMPLASR